jgi:hypothetical protein
VDALGEIFRLEMVYTLAEAKIIGYNLMGSTIVAGLN